MKPVTLRDRFRYRFDRMLARGSSTAIWWVAGLAVVLSLLGGLTFWILGVDFEGRSGPLESFWRSLLIALGQGGVVTTSLAARLSTLVFVIAAIFLTGGLVGALVAAVNQRLDALRRGRSRVLEQGHTVVVGWSARLMPVLDELLAETPGGRSVVAVVLADRDKTQMEDDFRARHDGRSRSRVVFRSGKPSAQSDLEMVAVDKARSIIVLSEGSFVDATAVRHALSADALGPEDAHVVVELSNPRVARSLRASARVVTLTVGDVVADMCAQAIRTRGMAEIFEELLGFAGDEFYVVDPASTVGRPFVECVLAVPGMVVAGIVDATGSAVLAPAFDRTVSASDRLVVIAPDTPRIQSIQEGWSSGSPLPASASPSGVRAVIIGWNDAGRGVLQRLSDFLPAGSRVEVMADSTLVDGGLPEWSWPLEGGFTHTKHDPVQILAKIQDIEASVVAVLGYSDGMTEDEADALTLLTLLTMHRARENGSLDGVRVVAHLFDSDLSGLAQDSTGLTDFVVTDALASRMLVQISRHQELGSVFADLFDATGPVVDVVPISGEAREYGVVAAQAVAAGLIPIGVVNDETVTVNPTHDLRVRAGDSLVAISRK